MSIPKNEPLLLVAASAILVRWEVLSAKNATISVLLAWRRLLCRCVLLGLEEVSAVCKLSTQVVVLAEKK